MTYQNNVELYRRQLLRGAMREGVGYPFRRTPTKAAFNDKLMKYARRAGKNYMGVFNSTTLVDQDLLIGWAGKKLKAKMREKNRIHLGKKAPKIKRVVYKNTMLYLGLRDTLLHKRIMPVGELITADVTIHELVQITICRNGKKGSMQLLDAEGKYRTIQWQEMPTASEADVLLAWSPLQVVKTWSDSTQTEPRALFRAPRLRNTEPGPANVV